MPRTVIAVGDLHKPFSDKKAERKLLKHIAECEGKLTVVQVGDAFDMFSFSRFARSHNILTPQQEMEQGRAEMEQFWELVKQAAPKATCYQLAGNHDVRPLRKILEVAPAFESFVKGYLRELLTFNGVTTIHDPREELLLDNVAYIHGYKSKLGDHAKFNQRSVVCGHSHRGGTAFIPLDDQVIWELNCGYLGDRFHPAMGYTFQKKATTWTLGYGVVDYKGPRFVTL